MSDQIDVGRFMRIKTAIERVLAGATGAGDAQGLRDSYIRLRAETREALPDSLLGELDRVAPPYEGMRGSIGISPEMVIIAGTYRAQLNGLAGWLQGFIDEANQAAQIQANAEAYASERVKAERGIGFRAEKEPDGKAAS